jgi:thioredoxin-like negative regulator of GroEL
VLARVIVAVLALSACQRSSSVPSGDVAATLTAKAIGEHAFDPASLKGKPSLVMFVSPVCPHCTKEMPIGAKVAHEVGANVLAIFVVGKPQNAADIARTFPGISLWDDGTLRKQYGIKAVPYTLVLAPDGHAVDAFEGAQDESTLRDALADAR